MYFQMSTVLFCYVYPVLSGSSSTLISVQSSIICVHEFISKRIVWEQEDSEQQMQKCQSYTTME